MSPTLSSYTPPDYQVEQRLGSGQTSHVYLARHPRHKEVALKLPRSDLKTQPVLWRMFENEVQITLNLKHKNVVSGIDGYPTGEQAYLVLEYCEGGTLDGLLLERGLLPLERACNLVLDVARGLAYSHTRGVLHRDVKPANVFLGDSGERCHAKLGDFGTGMFMADASPERVGTAFYMAPEIFRGEGPSVRSDVYSLGILAYEVLAGTRPFHGDSYDALMMAHLSGLPKPLAHHRKGVGSGAAKVVAQAMSRDPGKRYASVDAFIADFEKIRGRASSAEEFAPAQKAAPAVGRSSRVVQENKETEKETRRGFARLFGWRKS